MLKYLKVLYCKLFYGFLAFLLMRLAAAKARNCGVSSTLDYTKISGLVFPAQDLLILWLLSLKTLVSQLWGPTHPDGGGSTVTAWGFKKPLKIPTGLAGAPLRVGLFFALFFTQTLALILCLFRLLGLWLALQMSRRWTRWRRFSPALLLAKAKATAAAWLAPAKAAALQLALKLQASLVYWLPVARAGVRKGLLGLVQTLKLILWTVPPALKPLIPLLQLGFIFLGSFLALYTHSRGYPLDPGHLLTAFGELCGKLQTAVLDWQLRLEERHAESILRRARDLRLTLELAQQKLLWAEQLQLQKLERIRLRLESLDSFRALQASLQAFLPSPLVEELPQPQFRPETVQPPLPPLPPLPTDPPVSPQPQPEPTSSGGANAIWKLLLVGGLLLVVVFLGQTPD